MLVVNFLGAPGSGKSTGAAKVFSDLKMAGINAELVTEFAKDKVYEESKAPFDDQLYLLGEQNFRLSRLEGKVDVVLTDSPIILSIFYDKHKKWNMFEDFCREVFDSYNNYNVFVTRAKPYNPSGRFQTEEESNILSDEMKAFLNEKKIEYCEIKGQKEHYELISKAIIDILELNGGTK